jgi:predicted nucleic acid-binding protein
LTFVDSNVLLDALTEDPKWAPWSSAAIEAATADGGLLINDIVYAELAVGFPTIESLDHFVAEVGLKIVPMPRSAFYLAAKTHLRYRRAGGTRTSVLPDFFIGAQAAVSSAAVLTRDARRFRTYFPTVELISPETD